MKASKDITGQRFDRLVAISPAQPLNKARHTAWLFRCDCGREKVISLSPVKQGRARSCDCGITRGTHSLTKTRIHRIWSMMKQRCSNPKNSNFLRYGGRGIGFCAEWRSFDAFNAWAMAHGYADTLQLDRIDNDGNYEPGNCHFVTGKQNCRNRANTKMVIYGGETLPLAELAERHGLSYSAVVGRLRRGHTLERALLPSTP